MATTTDRERHLSEWDALHADVAAGRRSLRDLTPAEYELWNVDWLPDEFGLSPAHAIGCLGWIPIGIVAIVGGFISGDWSLSLLTALAGTIAGYVAAVAAVIAYVALDNRWLRLGHQVNAAYGIFLTVGAAVALLVAARFLIPDLGDTIASLAGAWPLVPLLIVLIGLVRMNPIGGDNGGGNSGGH
jgi:hypothetical protein